MIRSSSAIERAVSSWSTACQPAARAASTFAATSSRNTISLRLDPEPRGGERVDGRVGLGQADLVGVDDVVGHLLEAPVSLGLPRAGSGVRQDPGLEPPAPHAGEPVDQRLVEGADVPAPVVGHQLVGLRVAEAEPALPVPADLASVDLAQPGVPVEVGCGRDRPRRPARGAVSNGAGKTASSITSSTEPMSKTTALITKPPRVTSCPHPRPSLATTRGVPTYLTDEIS